MEHPTSLHTCTVQRRNGAFCDSPAAEDMPFPICNHHAIKLYVRMVEHAKGRLGVLHDNPATDKALEAAQRAREAQSVVYYIKMLTGRVKIGYTIDLRARTSGLRVPAANVLALEPGGKQVESIRHRQFAAIRYGRTEEFDHTPDLATHIGRVVAQHGSPIKVQADLKTRAQRLPAI